jgi:hypothetical protein
VARTRLKLGLDRRIEREMVAGSRWYNEEARSTVAVIPRCMILQAENETIPLTSNKMGQLLCFQRLELFLKQID